MPAPRNNPGDVIRSSEWNELADLIDTNTADIATIRASKNVFPFLVSTTNVPSTAIQGAFDAQRFIIGNTIVTGSYRQNSSFGGNAYRVVASGTGTADSGRFINFTGFQLQGIFGSSADVTQFGAWLDGAHATEDTLALTTAIATVQANGGGTVFIPAGKTILVNSNTVTIPSNVTISGANGPAVIRKATAGTTLATVGFENAPTTTTNAIYDWGLFDIIIDGNNLGGDGLRTFGSGHNIDRVSIVNHGGVGWVSRYTNTDDGFGENPVNDGLNGHVGELKLAQNVGGNLDWDGPHDSTFDTVTAVIQSVGGVTRGSLPWNVKLGTHGGSQFNVLHAWGNAANVAVDIYGAGYAFNDIYAEGGVETQIYQRLGANNCRIHGYMQAFPLTGELPIGLEMESALNDIRLVAANCYGAMVSFANEPPSATNQLNLSGYASPIDWTTIDPTDMVKFAGAPLVPVGEAPPSIPVETVGAFFGRIGFYGAPPIPQQARPVTLSDVIQVLFNLGLTA